MLEPVMSKCLFTTCTGYSTGGGLPVGGSHLVLQHLLRRRRKRGDRVHHRLCAVHHTSCTMTCITGFIGLLHGGGVMVNEFMIHGSLLPRPSPYMTIIRREMHA